MTTEALQLRVHGAEAGPTLVHLPGLHGDWTLLGPFRAALGARARLVETTYPRRPEWTLDDYAVALETALAERGISRVWLLAESFSSQVAWQILARREALGGETALEGAHPDTAPGAPDSDPAGIQFSSKRAGSESGAPAMPAVPGSAPFDVAGLILVGGFVKHPWPWGVRVAHGASRVVPLWLLKGLCALYGRSASRRCCATPEVAAEIEEFVRRRTVPADREALSSRYRLIARADFRPVARRARLPVYQLSGAIDPIVPWWNVAAWLKRDCPGFRASRIVRRAGHNVLLDAPDESVKQILAWIGSPKEG